jgi:hypothetical protein
LAACDHGSSPSVIRCGGRYHTSDLPIIRGGWKSYFQIWDDRETAVEIV